ncbi:unnamed protein product [Adineta steineri]|uniref:Uncharacterized protein n=1 Tax=Adineta steineri TaxID=433720 RepID=A0A815L833_9BILA|nr:unnamed protein product [Adineta steineri]CAF1406386.1 unnamed protein product [Adineta steineri]CAF1436625.1 unnamed protein product [Adineta steineri]CAF3817340.1 unnamed protein product [Adineta steineri]CAF3824998.1 unnamed protein product [Adineta steineri]
MELLLAAGAVGLAGYALGKRRERHQVENGFVTFHGNGSGKPEYGNVHYGREARNYQREHRHQSHSHSHHQSYRPAPTATTAQLY